MNDHAGAVLVIDDDADTRHNLRDILELDDYRVETAGSVGEALRRTDWADYVAVLLDRRLPDGDAAQVLPRLRQLAPAAAFLIITGHGDVEGAIAALRLGAADYLLKPLSPDLLRSRLAGVVHARHAAAEIGRLNKDLQHRVTELQALLDVVPIGIAIAQDPACRFVRANRALTRLLRVDPGANVSMSAPEGERPPVQFLSAGKEVAAAALPLQQAAARGVEVPATELELVLADGTAFHLLVSAAPLFDEARRPRGAIAALVDVTERKRDEERLLQSERLAAIGQMMTGLAHESGNALARSQSCLEMLSWEVEDRPEAVSLIGRIQNAQDHLKQLYEEVRGYAAPLRLELEDWDVGWVWRQAWDHLAVARQGRDAVLADDAAGVDLRCPVDQFRLEQVFRNILENALAACKDPVRVTVWAEAAELDGRPALRVAVRDNGPGLGPEQARRIFEPFFTTKTKGTGLGMAIAKRIVEAHGGGITAHSAPGAGAEIVLLLPRANP
jgi:signal transduction histidine kinase